MADTEHLVEDFDIQLFTISAAITAARKEGYQVAVLAVKPERLNFVYKFEGFDTKTQRLLIRCFRELIYRTNCDDWSHPDVSECKQEDVKICRDGFYRHTRTDTTAEQKLDLILGLSSVIERNKQSTTLTAPQGLNTTETAAVSRQCSTAGPSSEPTVKLDGGRSSSNFWDSEAESTTTNSVREVDNTALQSTQTGDDMSEVMIKVEPSNEENAEAVYEARSHDVEILLPKQAINQELPITYPPTTHGGDDVITSYQYNNQPFTYPHPQYDKPPYTVNQINSCQQCSSQHVYGYMAQRTHSMSSPAAGPSRCSHQSTNSDQHYTHRGSANAASLADEWPDGLYAVNTQTTPDNQQPESNMAATQKRPVSWQNRNNEGGIHSCPYCEFAAASKHEFYAHLRTAHQPSGKCKLHACPFCPYTTIRIADMKRHLGSCKRKKHANANGVHITAFKTKSRVCPKCSYTTVRKGDMNRHIRMKHEKWRPFKCQHCHQSFSYMRNLNSHLKSQHGQSANGDDNTAAADAAAAASDST